MAKIESLWAAPSRERAGTNEDDGAWSALRPEILELLAEGDPPAFATDSRERIVFWNHGASALLGRRSEEALGRHCYEVVCGRDVFGNRLCYANCAVSAMARAEDAISGFEVRVPSARAGVAPSLLHVTILRVPGPRRDLFTLVHVVSPVDEAARVARLLGGLDPAKPRAPAAAAESPPLTPRETEILQLVAAGLRNKEIAEKLGLSLATVRNHVHNTLEKLDVHSKLEMTSLAFRNGWVRTAPPTAPSS